MPQVRHQPSNFIFTVRWAVLLSDEVVRILSILILLLSLPTYLHARNDYNMLELLRNCWRQALVNIDPDRDAVILGSARTGTISGTKR